MTVIGECFYKKYKYPTSFEIPLIKLWRTFSPLESFESRFGGELV